MMNKHICRAKRVQDGEWVYGYYAEVYGAKPVIITSVCMEDDCSLSWEYEHVNPDTVCRCTNMKDKNGVLIYENDCIGHMLNVVEYVNDGFYINGDRPLSCFAKYFEVVCNRFD